jgi:hypothetical protein
MSTGFLNVDLLAVSRTPLDLVATELGKKVIVLYSGECGKRPKKYMLSFELAGIVRAADAAVVALCTLIERLSPGARRLWNSADSCFDVGYELRDGAQRIEVTLKTETIARVQRLRATLKFTCYRRETEADIEATN